MSEKFNLMNSVHIVRDDKCISLANALKIAKKCSDNTPVIVKIGVIEVHSLCCSQKGKFIVLEMKPGKMSIGALKSVAIEKRSKIKYNDEFHHMKNIKCASLQDGRLILQG